MDEQTPKQMQLKVTDGSTVIVDEQDFWRFWKNRLHTTTNNVVYYRDEEGKSHRLHRAILEIDDNRIVTFLDGNPRNCTRSNLLVQDRGIFGRSRGARGACKYKGVSPYRKGRWQATIRINGKLKWIGAFATAEEAARAYDDAVLEYRGRVGLLNFPTRARRRSPGSREGSAEG
jgi:hypothetical protein